MNRKHIFIDSEGNECCVHCENKPCNGMRKGKTYHGEKLTLKESELIADLLIHAGHSLLGNICNDTPESLFANWTIDERRKFVEEYHHYNGDREEYNENHLIIPDFALAYFLSHKLTVHNEIEE